MRLQVSFPCLQQNVLDAKALAQHTYPFVHTCLMDRVSSDFTSSHALSVDGSDLISLVDVLSADVGPKKSIIIRSRS